MAKPKRLWDGITEDDFIRDKEIEVVDIAEYNKENMVIFATNVNLSRQLVRLSDSLKPVERRILYVLYNHRAFPNSKMKSVTATGDIMKIHVHGDASIYSSIVGMAQSWKKQCTLVKGIGNFGTSARPEVYASARYTQIALSKYAKECFFDDYDEDCVEMIFNSASDDYEPMSLPAKFPNIVINGGMGIAIGNSFRIPPYNINDIIRITTELMTNPLTADCMMIPDLPSGCQIIDDGTSFREIIDTGKGKLKMRADVEIYETKNGKNSVIEITSLPWMTSLTSIEDKISSLASSGAISIKDTEDHSYAVTGKDGEIETKVDFRIILDKSHDAQTVLNKLYSATDLEKTVSIDFRVVTDNLKVRRFNMRDILLSWVDNRRGYKRSLFNKKLSKLSAKVDLLDILIHLMNKDNLEKTVKVIKNSTNSTIADNLMKLANMSSYQAGKIADMRMGAFNKEAREDNIRERDRLIKDIDDIMDIISSPHRIDEIIVNELKDLIKYAKPRQSKIIKEDTGEYIPDTEHRIVITNSGMVKKLHMDKTVRNSDSLGSFKNNDYPTHLEVIKNTESIMMIDSNGRYSVVPVHKIDSHDNSHYGVEAYKVSKLNGKIICLTSHITNDLIEAYDKVARKASIVSLTKQGFIKKTELGGFTGETKDNSKMMKIRPDDSLVDADIIFDDTVLLVYTRKGKYMMVQVSDLEFKIKDSTGTGTIKLVGNDDEVVGYGAIGLRDNYVVVLTEKGVSKKIPVKYFGIPNKKNPPSGQLMPLDASDGILFVSGMREGDNLVVRTRRGPEFYNSDDIQTSTKTAKGRKLVTSCGPSGQNIIKCMVTGP